MKPRRIDLEGTRPFLIDGISHEDEITIFEKRIKKFLKPVVQITLSGEDTHHLEEIARKHLSDNALYLSVKRRAIIEDNILTARGVLDVESLVREMLKDFEDAEEDFGLEVFRSLSKNEIEEAQILTGDFYKRWKNEGG
jgi:hypothetical protein